MVTLNKRRLIDATNEDRLFIANLVFSEYVTNQEKVEIGKNYINYELLGGKLNKYMSDKLSQFSTSDHFKVFKYLTDNNFDLSEIE